MPEYRYIPTTSPCHSTVAAPGERVFCVTVKEMVKCGTSESYLKKSLNYHRDGKVSCWPHHKDKRVIYLHYNGLGESYKTLIRSRLLNGADPEGWNKNMNGLNDITTLFKQRLNITREQEAWLDNARLPTGEALSGTELIRVRETLEWLSFLAEYSDRRGLLTLGYKTVPALYEDVIKVTTALSVRLPRCYQKLQRKVSKYKAIGFEAALDLRKKRNVNASSLRDAEQTAFVARILSDGVAWNAIESAMAYNAMAGAKGWESLTPRSMYNVKSRLHAYVKAGRSGAEAFRNTIGMQVRRSKPAMALSYWTLDGWDAELYYQQRVKNAKGHEITTYNNRLTTVIVLDASCDYPIGYAIGDRENTDLIKLAVKNAIDHCKELFGDYHRPYQIQSDHFGIKTLTPFYEGIAEMFTPARVKNAKAKRIERYNRHYNGVCKCLFKGNWAGVGIKGRPENQPNTDVLDMSKRDFPDRAGCVRQLEAAFLYDREMKRETFLRKFEAMPTEERLVLSRENYLYKFGCRNERTRRLEAGSFTPTILGERRDYDTFDLEFRKEPLTSWTVMYDPSDLRTILVADSTEKRRFLLEAKYVQPLDLHSRGEGDYEALRKIDHFNKNVLEAHVTETISSYWEIAGRLVEENKDRIGKMAYVMLSDSTGQHKSHLKRPPALIPSESDLAATVAFNAMDGANPRKKAAGSEKARAMSGKEAKKGEEARRKRRELEYDALMDKFIDFDKYK